MQPPDLSKLSAEICAAGQPCHVSPEEYLWRVEYKTAAPFMSNSTMERARASVARRLAAADGRGRSHSLIFLGPNVLSGAEMDGVFCWMPPGFHRMAMVDANPSIIETLRGRLEGELSGIVGNASVQVIHKAVCGRDVDHPVHLCRLSSDFYRDAEEHIRRWQPLWPDINKTFVDMASLDRRFLYHLEEVIIRYFSPFGFRWKESYVEEVEVPCAAPSTLLEELGMPVGDVDVLVTDIEGIDVAVMLRFLAIPNFFPAAMIFECFLSEYGRAVKETDFLLTMFLPLANELTKRGYNLYQQGENVVALLA